MKLKRSKNKNIITFMNKYWNSRGYFFGEIIHELKPLSLEYWKAFLFGKKFYLLNYGFLKRNGFRKLDNKKWIKYLITSFYKLYISETKAIELYKSKGIELIKAPHELDLKYGIDFYYQPEFPENRKMFLIVKHGIKNPNNLAKYKQINFFNWGSNNLSNSTIMAYSSVDNKQYCFEPTLGTFVEFVEG